MKLISDAPLVACSSVRALVLVVICVSLHADDVTQLASRCCILADDDDDDERGLSVAAAASALLPPLMRTGPC